MPLRVEMAPAPPQAETPLAAPVNIRGIGVLGPPPPYRPIVQAGAAFERGPAPDLEPWRLASLTHTGRESRQPHYGRGEEEDEWSLPREAEARVDRWIDPDDQRESGADRNAQAVPVIWPAGPDAPQALPASGGMGHFFPHLEQISGHGAARPRRIVPVLVVVGIVSTVVALGGGLYAGRETVMRAVPRTVPIYAAIGRVGGKASAVLNRAIAKGRDIMRTDPAARCAAPGVAGNGPGGNGLGGNGGRPNGRDAGCENNKPDPAAK